MDLQALSDEEVRGEPIVRTALLALRHVFDQHLGRQAVPILREVHAVEDADARRELMKSLVDYLSNARDQVERRELEDAVQQVFRGAEGEEIMVTIGEAWMRDGAVAQAREYVLKAVQLRFREVLPGLHELPDLEGSWSVVRRWSIASRYRANVSQTEATDLYNAAAKRRTGILSWMRRKW